MSELAFNANGESFDVPATVTAWRVRRLKPRGAPELVYGKDGRPLTINVEADIDELRNAVVSPGRYRLDAVNDDGKSIENVPAAYVQVVRPEREPAVVAPSVSTPSEDTIREAMRLNTELAKSVIDQFPAMMMSAAELLRAADGAGLPARKPARVEEQVDDDGDDADELPAMGGSPLLEMITQFAPVIIATLAPKLGPLLAAPKAIAAPTTSTAAAAPKVADAAPSLDPATLAKVMAIQAQLTPAEAARARQLGAQLSPTELRAFFDQLADLPVPEAVSKIRSLIGTAEQAS